MIKKPNRPLIITAVVFLLAGLSLVLWIAWPPTDIDSRLGQRGLAVRDIGLLLSVLGTTIGLSAFFFHLAPVRWAYAKLVLPLTMILSSTLVCLTLIEIVLHLKYRDIQVGGGDSPSSYTFYRKYYKTNGWGFRDIERNKFKKPGTFRILALGDSFTFGAGVKYKESIYTAVLEQRLNSVVSAGAKFEVINSGLKGLSTADELKYLQESGLALSPDLVLVGHVLNDAETPELLAELRKNYRESTILPPRYHRLLNKYSFTYYLVRQNFIALYQTATTQDAAMVGYNAYLRDLYSGSNLGKYEQVMVELTRTCEDRGIPVVWISFPRLRVAHADPYPFSEVTIALLEIAERNQLRLIDLHQSILARDSQILTVSAWDGHPNEFVHKIAADAIFDRLIADQLIPITGYPN